MNMGSEEAQYRHDTPSDFNDVCDWEVAEWEEKEEPLKLLVCSNCGFIAQEIVEHKCDGVLCDWWELNVKCCKKDAIQEQGEQV